MSTERFVARRNTPQSGDPELIHPRERFPGRAKTISSSANGQVQKAWCAPMTEAGEWVVTWTRVPGALAYEVQTSLDGSHWSSGSKFTGSRAVLLQGPAPLFW